MSLEQYKRKRDFGKTPEPRAAGKAAAGKGPRFVVQKHDASRLHYDLRLQIDGVLASWAVPKGPSLDPSHKRLAVHVEDHPLEYGDFEGVIPEGQYGGGTVLLWDRGTWAPEEKDPGRALKRGKLSFTLEGEKLRGAWTLARLHGRKGGDDGRDNWLLIKRDDEEASRGRSVVEERPESVKTGRSLEEVAEAEGTAGTRTKRPRKAGAQRAGKRKQRSRAPAASALEGARAARLPRGLRPQLCTLADAAPEGEGWLHEIKFDGYRLLAVRDGEGVRLISRNDNDWTGRFAPIAEAIAALPVEEAVIDGEAAILEKDGRTSFQKLQNAIKTGDFGSLVFFAFDLLFLDGYDLTRTPLLARKEALREIVPWTGEGVLRYSDHVRGGGGAVHTNACELALEGIICKRADAPYTQGRSRTWLKVKCSRRQEFVVVGWSPPSGSRKHFGSLLLGAYDGDGTLSYVGRVGTGFTAASLRDIRARLERLERETSPADEPPTGGDARGARWVKPELVAEVEFTEWTDEGRLRHPSFQGLREDKPAGSVRVEEPEVKPRKGRGTPAGRAPAKRRGAAVGEGDSVAGVRLSNPDRVLYPEQGETKRDVALYYEAVAERIMPFIGGRPLSTVRCPRGRGGKCFFQKHLGETMSEPIRAMEVREKTKRAAYISIDSVEGLIALVQFGVLEIHPWGARGDDVEHPDQIIFDLDPGPGVEFDRVKEAARHLRAELRGEGLESRLKTTGGKGLHVVAPLRPRAGWDEAKAWCAGVARRLAAAKPKEYVATMTKSKRTGRIFVDYLRNGRGATAIAPYSTRARPGAPVAMPLAWEELSRLDAPDKYTIGNAARRLSRLKRDPWEGFFETEQVLPGS